MEQRLIPIHLCPQCGSRYVYTNLGDKCPDCNYVFEKEESMSMIVHCPICLGDELVIRIKPYFGDSSGDSLSDKLYEKIKEYTQDSYAEVGLRHAMFKSLCDQFETIANTSIFELRCEQCGKVLCDEGTNMVFLMKELDELNSEEENEMQEPTNVTIEDTKNSRKRCVLLIILCLLIIFGTVIIIKLFIG